MAPLSLLERTESHGTAKRRVLEDLPSPSAERPVLTQLKGMSPGQDEQAKLKLPTLDAGEQYRFHFDMTRCIGCRCCEVACNEQNNNPPEVSWRRVGEIEGGSYPNTMRLHLSMACNHCLEPSCLEGCPVDAYSKADNGIVLHDAEACIGCQYCTWNCPYGVPQYHAERRIVTKCHMCVDRIGDGDLPACVEACPTSAIEIEAVNVAEWRQAIHSADAPGVPPADLTLSTTRITLPDTLPESMGATSVQQLEPEAAHPSLIGFLVLSQISVGLFGATLAFELMPRLTGRSITPWLSLVGLLSASIALLSSLFHLGRPIHAWRAMKAWRRSWLSREVLAFGLFAPAGAAATALLWLRELAILPGLAGFAAPTALGVATLAGVLGVASSAGIYWIPARPAWHHLRTPLQFLATTLFGASGGALAVAAASTAEGRPTLSWMAAACLAAVAVLSAWIPWSQVLGGLLSSEPALRGTAILLSRDFAPLLWGRTLLLVFVICLLPLAVLLRSATASWLVTCGALVAVLLAELLGRYLFFVTVVPRNMPGSYFTTKAPHGTRAQGTGAR